jgi:hypothetical protein
MLHVPEQEAFDPRVYKLRPIHNAAITAPAMATPLDPNALSVGSGSVVVAAIHALSCMTSNT